MKRSKNQRGRARLLWVLSLALIASSNAALVDEGKYPPAEKILDAYVDATGGLKAYRKIDNRVTRAKFELVDAGISAPIEIYAARPGKVYTRVESDALGKIEKGTDGETVWEITTMTGPVVKDDPERAQTLRDSFFDRMAYWRDSFERVETVGVEEIEGRPCYKVIQTHASGKSETFHYDKESHLLVKYESVVETQMGAIPVEAYLSDHKKVDGLLLPHKTTVIVMGQKRSITVDSIEHNVVPASRFALPDEIQAIVNRDRASAGSN